MRGGEGRRREDGKGAWRKWACMGERRRRGMRGWVWRGVKVCPQQGWGWSREVGGQGGCLRMCDEMEDGTGRYGLAGPGRAGQDRDRR